MHQIYPSDMCPPKSMESRINTDYQSSAHGPLKTLLRHWSNIQYAYCISNILFIFQDKRTLEE